MALARLVFLLCALVAGVNAQSAPASAPAVETDAGRIAASRSSDYVYAPGLTATPNASVGSPDPVISYFYACGRAAQQDRELECFGDSFKLRFQSLGRPCLL